jgi:hypothetical protein
MPTSGDSPKRKRYDDDDPDAETDAGHDSHHRTTWEGRECGTETDAAEATRS